MAKRERSGFKTFKQTKRGENSCSACSSHENSNPVEQNICQRKMFFVFLWVWKKEKILSSHKESIFRPRALMLYHWATETLRLSPIRSSYMIRVLHTARVSRAQNLLSSLFLCTKDMLWEPWISGNSSWCKGGSHCINSLPQKNKDTEYLILSFGLPDKYLSYSFFWFDVFFLDKEILPEIRCGLYPKIVPVQNGDGNVRNDPQFVMVNRCQGACDHGLAWQNCTATKWRSIDVIMTNPPPRNPTRPVIEHEACECQCHVRCNDQIHERDVNNCQCNCKTRCKVDETQILDTCECVPRAGKRNVLY